MSETVETTSTGPIWGFEFHRGDRLRKARDERGLTQEQLAELSSVSRASIANYEAGKPMRKLQGRALALALGVSFDWLYSGSMPDDSPEGIDARPERFELPTFWLVADADDHLTSDQSVGNVIPLRPVVPQSTPERRVA